jgi:GT2 family glycosyltransferase
MACIEPKAPLVSVVIPTHNRKNKLKRLIKSIKDNVFHNIEIIVVDDASTDDTYNEISTLFPDVTIFSNRRKQLVSACRNIGIKNSYGDFIFIIDDDNTIDKQCIGNLVQMFLKHANVGVVAPLMYYYNQPEKIWCAGIKRNLITSRTITIGNGKLDRNNNFNKAIESDDFPNAFMVRKETVKAQGVLFDEQNFPFMYEESDFIARIRNNGWKVMLVPKAKIWHDVPNDLFFMGRYTNLKAYYLARNRIIFHKKYSQSYEFSIFKTIFLPFFSLTYTTLILQHWLLKGKLLSSIRTSQSYIKGIVHGIALSREIAK